MLEITFNNEKIENIKLVIFDKDGTFIDIHKYWGRVVELRAKEILKKYSMPKKYYKNLCDVMGYDIEAKILPSDSPVGLYSRNKVQEILNQFLIDNGVKSCVYEIEEIFKTVGQNFISEQDDYTIVIPEAIRLMEQIKNTGGKMVVITSDSKFNAKHTINKNHLEKYFENIYGAEDSKTPKTSGEIVKKALKEMKVSKENTICIGDTYDDFLMAKNSGIKCLNVSTGIVTKKQHLIYNKFCVESLAEVEIKTM